MKILGKVTEFLASDVISDAIDKSIKTIDKLESKIPEQTEIIKLKQGEMALLIKQDEYTWKDKFNIYDNHWNIKYTVKGEMASLKHKLHIYDLNNQEVATIQKKLLKFRIEALIYPVVDFVFKIRGKKVGTLKEKGKLFKTTFKLDNGWIVDGNIFSSKYKIKSDDKILADIIAKKFEYDTYVVKYNEYADELMILMIVLALDTRTADSRVEELKNAHNHRHWFWKI